MKEKDSRIKRAVFPASAFVIALVLFALLTTVQMRMIGNYIDYRSIPIGVMVQVIAFWMAGAVFFTLLTSCQLRVNYDQPLERLSDAARKVAAGDFSVYLRPRHTPDKADKIDVLTQDFNKMVEELGSMETLRTDFFSDVSHEFKTPLAVICSNAELLQKSGGLTERQQEQLDGIQDAGRRLSHLIYNMLKLNKLEKQTIQPVPESYDLCAQLAACAVQFEDEWERRNIEFDAELEERAFARADPGLMELVWNNLLSNAIKFTPCGGRVSLTQTRQDGWISVTVRDTGRGMDEETQRHIYDKFYQGDAGRATQGNGLGLTLVRRILELSDAEITVQSAPGQGAAFTVRLPAATEREEP